MDELAPDLPHPNEVMHVLLTRLSEDKQDRINKGVIHDIRVTPTWIAPHGFTWVWRTDGERTLYVSYAIWVWIPRQKYAGLPLIEVPDEHEIGGYALTAIPVYMEPGCPD